MSDLIHKNISFHNVAELEAVPGLSGLKLQRFPEKVRNALGHKEHERGRFYSQVSVGCEIRFVTTANFIKIALSSLENEGVVYVYKGDFLHSVHSLPAGIVTTLHLEDPVKLDQVDSKAFSDSKFSPQVWRFLFGKNTTVCFHYLDTFGHDCRPPLTEEKPDFKILAYGSSITFGGDTNLYTNAYIQQTARRLGWDILNKGIAGSCFCEEIIGDYLAGIESDIVILELGVNMRGRFTPIEYEQRVNNLINQIRKISLHKPIVLIGIFPNSASMALDQGSGLAKANILFNQISEEIVTSRGDANLYYIPGNKVLTSFSGLSTDLLHPSDDGHILMGENLARELKVRL